MSSNTITVSNAQQLYDALARSTGGETILLEGGNYGKLSLTTQSGFDYEFPSTVTIASADPADPAVFSGADVRGGSNLAIEGVTFDYIYKPGDPVTLSPFSFSGVDGLTITDSTFDGANAYGSTPEANGFGTGNGLFIRGSEGVVLEGNEFFGFRRGLNVTESSDITVRGNEIYDMRSDGMNFSEVQGVLVEDNYIHDFRTSPTSGDHADMIQFWTNGTDRPSSGIVIRDNVLDIGNGDATQSIFMRNELVDSGRASFNDMAYRNVVIENNTITNAQKWGISVGEAVGVTISRNTVVHADGGNPDGADSGVEIPLINVASRSTGVAVTANVTSGLTGWTSQAGWTVRNNAFVQDQNPNAPGYYADVFVASSLQPGPDGSHSFIPLVGGMIDRRGAQPGAGGSTGGTGAQALFQVTEADSATRVFDASPSNLNGAALPPGTTYLWDFGDGTTARGREVSHSYADGGDYQVRLTIVLPGGTRATESAGVGIQGPEVLEMDGSGRFVAYDDGDPVALDAGRSAAPGNGLQLGAPGVSATVARTYVSDVVGADDMTIAFTLDADRGGSSGELFRLQGSFAVSVTKAGELQVQVMRDGASTVTLVTRGADLNGAANPDRDVVISLDDGRLQVWVDGELDGQVAMTGTVGGASGAFNSQNLVFGNPWGRANFNGDLKAFEISVGAGDYPPSPQTVVMSNNAKVSAMAPLPDLAPLGAALQVAQEDGGRSDDDLTGPRLDAAPETAHDRFLQLLERLDAHAA